MNDREKEALMQRYAGATIALTSLHEQLAEIQLFTLTEIWPEGSPEIDAASDTIEGIKALVARRNNQIVAAATKEVDNEREEE